MTYGYELEPLADISAKLGVTISRPLLDIVNDYAQSLPIVAAHVAPTGAKSFAVYWVSGSSLVMIEGGDFQNENGLAVGHTTGWVRSLSGVRADVEGAAMAELDLKNWTVYRTVNVQFENEALVGERSGWSRSLCSSRARAAARRYGRGREIRTRALTMTRRRWWLPSARCHDPEFGCDLAARSQCILNARSCGRPFLSSPPR